MQYDDVASANAAIGALLVEMAQLRHRERERAELWRRAHVLSSRIRQQLDPALVLVEAAPVIGSGFGADHVFIRLVPDVGTLAGSTLAADLVAGTDPAAGVPAGAGTADDDAPTGEDWSSTGAPAPSDPVRRAVADAVAGLAGGLMPPPPALGDDAVAEFATRCGGDQLLTVPFAVGPAVGGALVLVRAPDAPAWRSSEIVALHMLAQDFGRGLDHARRYHRERRLVEQLRALDRAKDEFLSTVSHELRTPLTNISGYVETLFDGDAGRLSPTQRKMLGVVQRNAQRLRTLIEDLLTLSQVESGAFRAAHETVNLIDLAREALADAEAAAARRGVLLGGEFGAGPAPVVDGDRSHLYRALANLLSNAVKFTPPGGRITVSACLADGSAVLSVADTGIGIPASDRPELFTRFFRASNASAQAIPGTGLGLTIVRAITRHHGGEIEVRSVENEGTTVTLRLPPRPPADGCAGPVATVAGSPVVDQLGLLRGPVSGVVELPNDLLSQPDRSFDLTDPGYLRWMYETVLAEATSVEQLVAWLDGATLVRVWPELYLPTRVRQEWESRHDVLTAR